MKKYLILAASALALAGCSSDEYLGGENPGKENGANTAINFSGATGKITRADHVGADAATLLGNKFIVAGYKGDKSGNGIVKTKVFDHYTVSWKANTAGTTDDNTSDWSYVGGTPQAGLTGAAGSQTIKYWDYGTGQYDYIAFSVGSATIKTGDEANGDNEVKVTKVMADKATDATNGAYTMSGTKAALAKCYIADLVTAYNPEEAGKPKYQDVVKFSFRNITSKVRVALYETIPGYSVKNVKFYNGDNAATGESEATLFTSDTNKKFYDKGIAKVYFPTVGTENISKSDYNKAHVIISGDDADGKTACSFGDLIYSTVKPTDSQLDEPGYLGQTSNNASYAKGSDNNHYTTVLPKEDGATLTLCVDYTLYADDKSGEEITVHGAKAIIPAIYAQWKSNYAYTYIFKISDKTNGSTGTGSVAGLFPITFDAVVADAEDGSQSTITTVADHSITTYQKGHDVNKEEYATGNDIYVMVHNATGLDKLNGDKPKTALYTVTKGTDNKTVITEATVHDALTIDSKEENGIVTGRNGITLTKVDFDASITSIPGVDGNDIKVEAGDAVKFTPEVGTYAFVYETTGDKQSESYYYTAETPNKGADLSKDYYKDPYGNTAATGTADGATVYYKKITNNGKTFAIKVIKVVAGN